MCAFPIAFAQAHNLEIRFFNFYSLLFKHNLSVMPHLKDGECDGGVMCLLARNLVDFAGDDSNFLPQQLGLRASYAQLSGACGRGRPLRQPKASPEARCRRNLVTWVSIRS